MLEGALLVVRGIQRDADEQHHYGQEDDAGRKVHALQFTYLIDAALYLSVNKMAAARAGAQVSARGLPMGVAVRVPLGEPLGGCTQRGAAPPPPASRHHR